MKTEQEFLAQVGNLTPDEIERLRTIRKLIEEIEKSKKINEANFQQLSNIGAEITSFTELFFWRIISALKQNHMLT